MLLKATPEKPLLVHVPTKNEVIERFNVWGQIHPLHTHPYLDWLFDKRNNDFQAVKRFVEVLYVFCNVFHECLFELLRTAHDENIRRDLVYNLFDEFGAGDPEHGHLELMRRLLRSMGYSNQAIDNITINSGAMEFMTEILLYCREEDPLRAIGCICIGAECNGSVYFRRIHDAFAQKTCVQGADLHVLEIHAGDDVEHRANMLALIDPYLNDTQDRMKISEGFLASVHVFQKLWTSMLYYEGLDVTKTGILKAA